MQQFAGKRHDQTLWEEYHFKVASLGAAAKAPSLRRQLSFLRQERKDLDCNRVVEDYFLCKTKKLRKQLLRYFVYLLMEKKCHIISQ
jgi:hypothetical protein